jgi:uncharacterized protein (DUF1501 family)
MSGCPDVSSKIVLIQLSGGNDGLNTVVLINQYDTYANLRPNIKLSNAGIEWNHQFGHHINAPKSVGLHPSLTALNPL